MNEIQTDTLSFERALFCVCASSVVWSRILEKQNAVHLDLIKAVGVLPDHDNKSD